MKNILLVNYYSYENGGGISSSCFLLARELKRQGHNVYIASTGEYPGIKTFVFHDFRFIPIFQLRDFYLSRFLKKIVKEYDIELVHAYDYRFSALGSLDVAQRNKIPCIVHYHDYWLECLRGDLLFRGEDFCSGASFLKCLRCQRKIRLPWEIYKYCYFQKKLKKIKDADASLAVGQGVIDRLCSTGIANSVYKVYNPVCLVDKLNCDDLRGEFKDVFDFAGGKKVVLFVGRLVEDKGVFIFLETAKSVYQENKKVVFLVVGDGELRDVCERFVVENNLSSIIKIQGGVAHKNIDFFYSVSDVVFLPTLYFETFHMVAVEAMSSAKSVVTSNRGANREIIQDGENGFLIDPCNKEECVEKILELTNDNVLRERVGAAAKERARDFEDVKIAKNISEIYEKIINEKRNK